VWANGTRPLFAFGRELLEHVRNVVVEFLRIFSGLSAGVSVAILRQTSCFDLASNMSTVRVPTGVSCTVVVEVELLKPRQAQPPPSPL
jgi:hypothetical protein